MSGEQRRQPKGSPASIGGQWAADADREATSIAAETTPLGELHARLDEIDRIERRLHDHRDDVILDTADRLMQDAGISAIRIPRDPLARLDEGISTLDGDRIGEQLERVLASVDADRLAGAFGVEARDDDVLVWRTGRRRSTVDLYVDVSGGVVQNDPIVPVFDLDEVDGLRHHSDTDLDELGEQARRAGAHEMLEQIEAERARRR